MLGEGPVRWTRLRTRDRTRGVVTMSRIRRLGRGCPLVALLAALAISLPSFALASAPPGEAVEASPSLSLQPGEGPPGIQVTAVASGFGECQAPGGDRPPITNGEVAPAGETAPPPGAGDVPPTVVDVVAVAAVKNVTRTPGVVRFSWDGDPLTTAPVVDAAATASFEVPDTASFDEHRVQATCAHDAALEASRTFTVTTPTEVPTVVPNLIEMTVDEAALALKRADLVLGDVSGGGDSVREQTPEAGTEAERGMRVDVVLGAEPALVAVPDLTDFAPAEAGAALRSRGLELGAVSGTGDVVREQSHAPGVMVPTGTTVDITVGSTVPPQVVVPDLIGMTVDEARAEASEAGLFLGNDANGDSTVEGQQPAAGTRVPAGSAVTVTLTEPASGLSRPSPWWAAVAAVAVLVGAAMLASRGIRTRRGEKWARTHVRAVPGTPPSGGITVATPRTDPYPPTRVIRIEPHTKSATHALEEVDR